MELHDLIKLALNNLEEEKNKVFVCMQLKDIINHASYLIVFGGTKNGITSIKPFKKYYDRNQFIPINFQETSNILPHCTSINIRLSNEANLQKTVYEIFHDIPSEDKYV